MSDQLTNTDSPPAKRSRTDAGPSTLPDPVIPVAATKAMFAPQRTKAEEKRRKRKEKHPLPTPYSNEDIMWHDVRDFLGPEYVDGLIAEDAEAAWKAPEGLEHGKEITIRAGAFTVSDPNGKRWAVITPFAHPGDLIRCKIYKHHRMHSNADMVEILEYDESARGGEGDRRKFPDQGCKYFGVCGGCQFHPMPYHLQLAHKKRTVKLAYERFSKLSAELVPEIQDTIPSPKQWGYRTKITPHFDAAPNRIKKAIQGKKSLGLAQASEESDLNSDLKNGTDGKWWMPDDEKREINWNLRIGFDKKAGSGVLDIEDCPIAAPIINRKMAEERKRVQDTILTYPRAATLLLRDSLPAPTPSALSPFDPSTPFIPEDEHVVVTNHKEAVYERVGDKLFTFTAGAFFQNNNSILVPLTSYVKDAVFPAGISDELKPTHLVDTYCGSGLFGITLSEHFEKVAGVEIDPLSVAAAKKNAEINNLGDKTRWLCGKAEDIFGGLPAQGFSGEKSCVVIDPPRKGCDELFLEQLIRFKPLTIVYVSCNVHTQARDVGWFMATATERGIKYELESLRGFDLFPQTAHVESVAVLRLST